jgi:HPt (histidine-containing phosphotransfer) domain-containing protein
MTQSGGKAIFDREVMLERLGGDDQLLDEVLNVFLEEAPDMMADLRGAVTGGDPSALERSAHSIKGALLNISADSPADLASRLEELGSAEQLDGTRLLLDDLEAEIDQLTRILQSGES